MNTIDRSVDSFDFALRRRFMWEEVEPNYDVIKNELTKNHGTELAESLENLNKEIEKDELLGRDYRIGHSYALALKNKKFDKAKDAKEFLWIEFIRPLMQEYLRGLGDNLKSNEKLKSFKNSFDKGV
jgi:5-methylcytosine-specific restriction protein B